MTLVFVISSVGLSFSHLLRQARGSDSIPIVFNIIRRHHFWFTLFNTNTSKDNWKHFNNVIPTYAVYSGYIEIKGTEDKKGSIHTTLNATGMENQCTISSKDHKI